MKASWDRSSASSRLPRDEVEGLEQAFVFFLDERVEAGPCVDTLGRESHDLALCSHLTWMHEEPPALKSPPKRASGSFGVRTCPRSGLHNQRRPS